MSIVASSASSLGAPNPGQVEVARPDIDPALSGSVFVGNVVYRISPKCDRPTGYHHPAAQVLVPLEADGDDPTVTVKITRLAGPGGASDPIGQREASLLSATPSLAGWSYTELAALGRVDAEKPNALAMNLDGVAVDDRGDADDLVFLGEYRRRRQQHQNKNRAANAFLAHDFSSRPSARDQGD
jgi:hypothetical protein